MKSSVYYITLLLILWWSFQISDCKSQNISKVWDKTYGGENFEWLAGMIPAIDGGVILYGTSASGTGAHKEDTSYGENDFWIVKVDADGNKIWDKTYGGYVIDDLFSICSKSNNYYYLAGHSWSPVSGNKSSEEIGFIDYWIIKVDQDGKILWDKTFGGFMANQCYSIIPTMDGNLLISGSSTSNIEKDKSELNIGNDDYWLIKIDPDGNKIWDKTYGGYNSDMAITSSPAHDGGALIAGLTTSGQEVDISEPSYGTSGTSDGWVLRINSEGNKIWDKRYGGIGGERIEGMLKLFDNNFLLVGFSTSIPSGNKMSENHGFYDCWILKIDENGNKLWDKSYGGNDHDIATSVTEDLNHGLLISAFSNSLPSGNKESQVYGNDDGWLLKLDSNGNKIWETTIGGSKDDWFRTILPLGNGEYLAAGTSLSPPGGNKDAPLLDTCTSCNSWNSGDFWLVKLKEDEPLFAQFIDFDAQQYNNTVRLQWETSMEMNND